MNPKKVDQTIGNRVDIGLKRAVNQDALSTASFGSASSSAAGSVHVYVVADGMGGHQAGELASQLAVSTVETFIREALEQDHHNYSVLAEEAAQKANEAVYNMAQENQLDTGTTLVLAIMVDGVIYGVNVGDSRAYLLKDEAMEQISKDHTMLQRLLETGNLDPKQAKNHLSRNILTEALGREESVKVHHFSGPITGECYLLLCSDGLWGLIEEEEIQRTITQSETSQEACDALVTRANQAGGDDNIAVLLVHFYPQMDSHPFSIHDTQPIKA